MKKNTKRSLGNTAVISKVIPLFLILLALPVTLFLVQGTQLFTQGASGLTGDVVVDFSSRQNSAHPISSHFAGMNGFSKIQGNTQITASLAPSHFDLMRVSVDMVGTFPSSGVQSWSQLDMLMNAIQSQNLQPILTIGYTPTWLQPNPNPCGTASSHVMPTSASAWGQLAAAVVAHMDQKFPTVHPLYELWNEPDGTTFMCVSSSDPNPDQTRLSQYKQIYGAAAPLMKQQAQRDGTTIQVGGPALAVPKARASLWFPALVSDPTIAPYLDFITYHDYQNGGAVGDTWPTFLAGTQNPTTGQAAIFEQISQYIRNGKQPNASQTPIYDDEYNTNTGLPNSARNDPTYAPLWNSLIIADLLNTVNDTTSPYGAAQQPIAGLAYFVSTQPPPGNEFCLFGTWNTAMDCTAGNTPYPQYYAYQLFTDPKFLDITNHAFVATSVSSQKPGVVATGFSTQTQDNIVLVNTSAIAYPALTVGFQNPGTVQNTTATVYTLNQANPQISSIQIPVVSSGNGYTTQVTLPAYATVAVSLPSSGSGTNMSPPPIATVTSMPVTTNGVTPSPTSLPSLTLNPTISITPTGKVIIFDTTVQNGFTDNTFGFSSKNPCDPLTFVISPCSYAITYNKDGAVEFRSARGGIDISSYKSFSFYINTGSLPVTSFSAVITTKRNNQDEKHEVQLTSSYILGVYPGGWLQIVIPLSQLDPNDKNAQFVEIRNFSNQSLPAIHLQNIVFQ